MRDGDHWDVERAHERDNDREPTRRYERKQRPQLTSAGTLRTEHEQAQRGTTESALALLRREGLL